MDTSEFTADESRLQYAPQSMKDEKYVFIEITNVDEAPYFDKPDAGNPELYTVKVKENNAIGSLVTELWGNDEDPGDAMNLQYSANDTSFFEFGTAEVLQPADKRGSIPFNIRALLDYEAKPVHHIMLTVTDQTTPNPLSSSQLLTIRLIDENEAPELRKTGNPGTNVASGALVAEFSMKEDALTGTKIGEIPVWDADADTSLAFFISGSENIDQNGQEIFFASSLPGNYTTSGAGSGAGPTGKIYRGILTLGRNGDIDYETKRRYELAIKVSDGFLNDTAKIVVNIENVNDVTVDDVRLLNWNASMTRDRATLVTRGGEKILITGKNFGIKSDASNLRPHLEVTREDDVDESSGSVQPLHS